jgi:hypothetical protein
MPHLGRLATARDAYLTARRTARFVLGDGSVSGWLSRPQTGAIAPDVAAYITC